jgi:hypothetical protein
LWFVVCCLKFFCQQPQTTNNKPQTCYLCPHAKK